MSTVAINAVTNELNITDYLGDTINVPIQYTNDAGDLVPLAGFTAKLSLFPVINNVVGVIAAMHLTQGSNTGITLGGTPNNIILNITAGQANTNLAGASKFFGELVIVSGTGVVETLFAVTLNLQVRKTQVA